ncbi:MAG TPA: C4-type zinc ribbon domain-containing protein [Deinococcales bacterium]|nr:C4-type zinc ribbon domain-containing protein [Deinococcales bacterium]
MSERLKQLADVQARDLEIDSLRDVRSQTPEELTDAQALKAELEAELAARQGELDGVAAEVRSADMELASLEERRKAAADSSLTAESPKEASQFQNQELQFATRVQEVEEDLLPLMEENERLEGETGALRERLEELEPRLQELTETEEERVRQVDADMEALAQERAELAEAVPKNILSLYEQIRRARKGMGMALVVNGNRCAGCNVHLPIHVVQKVRRPGAVERCPSCGRILHYTDA